jgi:L-threonylcarbamoyladenylate synthase
LKINLLLVIQIDIQLTQMTIFSTCTEKQIKQASQALIDGHLVAFPTETVYGLGADATNEKAVNWLYKVKGRPVDHPLIVHLHSINGLVDWASDVRDYAIELARTFWPGPMTLILPRTKLAKDFVTASQDNVGLRVPSHPLALKLLSEFENQGGKGIAAPSANRFGAVSPTTAEAVCEELGSYLSGSDLILGGENPYVGVESTIIDCTDSNPRIIRPGAITKDMIKATINVNLHPDANAAVKASGTHQSHYAPKARVVIDGTIRPGYGLIALDSVSTPPEVTRLAAPKDVEQFARSLYQAFRAADALGLAHVSVILPTGEGLEVAIRDRVEKAAARIG